MTPEGKAASVHDRLLARARSAGIDFNLILTRYALERILYRISASRFKDDFLLKGALLFSLWYENPRRPTRDADLLGLKARNVEDLISVFREIRATPCDDAMRFIADSVRASEIREDARYGGIRVDLIGMLGNARCPVQIDVGYGDIVTPSPTRVVFPAILEGTPEPVLKAYPRETVIAEKLEAIVSLGMANSRMKDFFDVWILVGDYPADRTLVLEAVRRTFERRGTDIPGSVPLGLSDEYAKDQIKRSQWKAFIAKNKLEAPDLSVIVGTLRDFWYTILGKSIFPT